jgi:hypothetical protein
MRKNRYKTSKGAKSTAAPKSGATVEPTPSINPQTIQTPKTTRNMENQSVTTQQSFYPQFSEIIPTVESLIYPGLTLLTSNVNNGSREIALRLAGHISQGKAILNYFTTIQTRVIYINFHPSTKVLKDAIKIFKDSPNCGFDDYYFQVEHIVNPYEYDLQQRLSTALYLDCFGVIFIDGIEHCSGLASIGDVMKNLQDFAHEHQINIIVLHSSASEKNTMAGVKSEFRERVDYIIHSEHGGFYPQIGRYSDLRLYGYDHHMRLIRCHWDDGEVNNLTSNSLHSEPEEVIIDKIMLCLASGLNNYEIKYLLNLSHSDYAKLKSITLTYPGTPYELNLFPESDTN